jgi:hypothetical protein
LLFLCAVAQPATAQTADGSTPVSLKIDLVAWGADIPGLSVKAGTNNAGVTAMGFRYSKPVNYSGPNILEISQNASTAIANEDGGKHADEAVPEASPTKAGAISTDVPPAIQERRKKNPSLVALAMLPTTSKRVTILMAPGPGGTFQTFVIDDDPTKLPFGQLRIHNFSPMTIALRCNGTAPKELKGKEAMLVAPQGNEVVYELAYMKDDAWKMQENNLVKVMADEQAQMIILKSDVNYFKSSDGSRTGFLQVVTLRRSKNEPEDPAPHKAGATN